MSEGKTTPQQHLRATLQKIADEITALKRHPAATDEYWGGYADGRHDACHVVQSAIDDLPEPPAPEPLLSTSEMQAQAERCNCHGSDDYCPCQNSPDSTTRRLRAAAQAAVDTGGLPIKEERELRAALATEGK